MAASNGVFRIAQISDLHCGGPYFEASLLERAIGEINELGPGVVNTIDSPYNTFQYRGLPPGPICSPGLGAIMGVAKPERTDYLYFVSRGDGTHAFSVTYEEHLQNVAKFNPQK